MTRPERNGAIACALALTALVLVTRAGAAQDARALRSTVHPCLAAIIDKENPPWDPTLDYGFGHGNVNEAYGLPQALPGTKMRSAGPDWRTNPRTQIRWMIRYVNERYGGACAALAFHRRNGWY